MDWSLCQKEFVREVEIDTERIRSIVEKARIRLKRAKSTIIDNETVSLVVEDYYEVIKELLVAYLLKNGLRSKNHQCLITYFYKNNPNHEREAIIISQMSYFRNRLDYYGESVPLEFYQKNKKNFEDIISLLESIIKK
jgi:uncharacterized protein (UPF0332 family)